MEPGDINFNVRYIPEPNADGVIPKLTNTKSADSSYTPGDIKEEAPTVSSTAHADTHPKHITGLSELHTKAKKEISRGSRLKMDDGVKVKPRISEIETEKYAPIKGRLKNRRIAIFSALLSILLLGVAMALYLLIYGAPAYVGNAFEATSAFLQGAWHDSVLQWLERYSDVIPGKEVGYERP